MKTRRAFTLIEMLVVIGIITILATMVVHMNAGAQTAKRNAAVNAQKFSLTLMINSYQSKLNYYPPDNGAFASNYTMWPTGSTYDGLAATNPLLYELTGATNNYKSAPSSPITGIQLFDRLVPTPVSLYEGMFNRSAVNNANTDEPHNFFYSGPQPKDYTNYGLSLLKGLLVPVPFSPPDPIGYHNFWHYDSSSTNRHNLQSYDLWAEYTTASRSGSNIITTNGNW